MKMKKLIISDLNNQFILDLKTDYVMECFKYSYIDSAGDKSSILDINTDSPQKGLIIFDNNIRDAVNMTDMIFYYKSTNNILEVAFKISQLSNLFEYNQQVINRLFINLYDLTNEINCKFKFFNSQSYVLRHIHKSNFIPFKLDNLSYKFSDSLSVTTIIYNKLIDSLALELRNFTKIKSNQTILNYKGNFFINKTKQPISLVSIFDNNKLTKIPNIEYNKKYQFNNEEYIIMSNFTIPILGQSIPELDYQDSRETYILLTTELEGGLNPSRKLKAIKVDQFVEQFKNIITVWDKDRTYEQGSIVKSHITNRLYLSIIKVPSNQNPVYRDLNGNIINRDAGKYWMLYDNIPIGSELTLHVPDGEELTKLVNYYSDSYILVGGNNLDSSIPDTWNNTLSFLPLEKKEDVLIQGKTEVRYFSKFNNDIGRYNRLIAAEKTALTQRDNCTPAHTHYIKEETTTIEGCAYSHKYHGYDKAWSTSGKSWCYEKYFWHDYSSGKFGMGMLSIGIVTGGYNSGSYGTGNKTRGDEIDKHYLIKVR